MTNGTTTRGDISSRWDILEKILVPGWTQAEPLDDAGQDPQGRFHDVDHTEQVRLVLLKISMVGSG